MMIAQTDNSELVAFRKTSPKKGKRTKEDLQSLSFAKGPKFRKKEKKKQEMLACERKKLPFQCDLCARSLSSIRALRTHESYCKLSEDQAELKKQLDQLKNRCKI